MSKLDQCTLDDPREIIESSNAAYSRGDLTSAETLITRAIDLARQQGDMSALASAYSNRGTVLAGMGKLDEALSAYDRAISLFETLGHGNRSKAVTLNQLAQVYSASGRPEAAVQLYRNALSIFEMLGEPASEAVTMSNLASAYAALGRYDEAEAFYRKAISIQDSLGDWRSAKTLNNLGSVYFALHDLGKAQNAFQESVSKMTQVLGENHPDALRAKVNLAQILAANGKDAEARSMFQAALTALRATLGSNHPLVEQLSKKGNLTIESPATPTRADSIVTGERGQPY